MTNKTKKQMNKAEMKKTKGGLMVSTSRALERKDKMLAPNTKAGDRDDLNIWRSDGFNDVQGGEE